MITRAIAIMAAVFLFTGCGGKKAETPTPVAQPQVQPVQPAPIAAAPSVTQPETPAPVAPTVAPQGKTNAVADLTAMSRATRAWMASGISAVPHTAQPSTQTQPSADASDDGSFESFKKWYEARGLQIPPPPPGKKYAFDAKMHVILVNR
jgi:hypothetical protein